MPEETMNNSLGEGQALLKDAVDRYLATEYGFDRRRKIIDSQEGFSREVWKAFADMGLLAAPFGEDYGGSDTFLDVMVIMEAFGRALVVEPYVSTVILAGGVLRRGGSEAQKRALIPGIAAGETLCALAFAEPESRYNLANVGVTASRDGDGFRINGRKAVVYGGPSADWFLVSARTFGGRSDRDGVSVFLVEAGAPGLTRKDYRTVDGMRASELDFADVRVAGAAMVGEPGGGLALVERAVEEATAAVCAEAVGGIAALNEKTREHCMTRVAFGQPLSKLQTVQHRLVDMWVAEAHAQAMTLKAFLELDKSAARCEAVVAAAKFQVGKEAVFVGQSAVQLHGAMGITDELDVSHYFRRLTMISNLFGGGDHQIRRYIEFTADTAAMTGPDAIGLATELENLTPDELAFRDKIRRFYDENLTDDMRQAARNTLHMSPFEYGRRWQKILHEHGYGATNWPVEYGGCDWTPTQHLIWAAETARARPPQTMGMGRTYCGPCLMKYGSQEQKDYFLPRIISGEDWWAQGYSEPGAGSDLASLQLAAVSDGDDYILNGSKIWTTFAHHANRIFCLVRTQTGPIKQKGITFLLIDIDTPGIEIRPIPNMSGDHDFNQVFFTDVRVPKSRRLGEENEGWSVARHLLLFEHGANLSHANLENIRRLGSLREIASQEADGHGGRLLDDPDFSRRIAELAIGVEAMEFASRQEFAKAKNGEPPSPRNELLQIRSKQIGQSLTELSMEAIGYYGAPFQPEARKVGGNVEPIGPEHALLPMPFYLSQRGATIAGGAPEAHRNNLAKRMLAL
ncbi:MAG TPA: acyl-CoA dehydrogenase family protein [Caulobacteraceae bacterium]|jgi:alkylation response protein AidB-like acyl-CoA dehydrogenase|nr:acyl-CoA dehydrogenase family protein [Caulobacteraceae bacterium]